MVRGSPSMCMSTTSQPACAQTPASSESPRSAVTSFTIVAPASIAASATTAFEVSIETSSPSRARASTTGWTRSSSSPDETASAPGRVDSPPTSRMSAPSAASSRPCSIARGGSRNCPPSENESGVTLTIPMTFAGSRAIASSVPKARSGSSLTPGPVDVEPRGQAVLHREEVADVLVDRELGVARRPLDAHSDQDTAVEVEYLVGPPVQVSEDFGEMGRVRDERVGALLVRRRLGHDPLADHELG